MWTTPRTWTTGEVVTAAQLNTHLRDNLDHLAQFEIDGTALSGVSMPVGVGVNKTSVTRSSTFSTSSTSFVTVSQASRTTPFVPDYMLVTASFRYWISDSAAVAVAQLALVTGTGTLTSRQISESGTAPEEAALVGIVSSISGTAFSVAAQIRTTNGTYQANMTDLTIAVGFFKAS